MSRRFPSNTLGIDQTQDRAAIRQAYADVLRGLNVEEDIAGYVNLRRARDEALWLAAQGAQEDEGDYGLGSLDDDVTGEVDSDYSDDWDTAPEPFHPEPLHDVPAPELTETQRRAQDAWQALLDILYPGGEVSEDSVTYAEMEDGLVHLAVLLDHARRSIWPSTMRSTGRWPMCLRAPGRALRRLSSPPTLRCTGSTRRGPSKSARRRCSSTRG
jgi:hypothetical protein